MYWSILIIGYPFEVCISMGCSIIFVYGILVRYKTKNPPYMYDICIWSHQYMAGVHILVIETIWPTTWPYFFWWNNLHLLCFPPSLWLQFQLIPWCYLYLAVPIVPHFTFDWLHFNSYYESIVCEYPLYWLYHLTVTLSSP